MFWRQIRNVGMAFQEKPYTTQKNRQLLISRWKWGLYLIKIARNCVSSLHSFKKLHSFKHIVPCPTEHLLSFKMRRTTFLNSRLQSCEGSVGWLIFSKFYSLKIRRSTNFMLLGNVDRHKLRVRNCGRAGQDISKISQDPEKMNSIPGMLKVFKANSL